MSLVALRNPRRDSNPGPDRNAFLPTTREEMEARGWDELDVLIVTGDAYVDHPAFGPILIAPLPRGARLPRRRRRAAALATPGGHRAHGRARGSSWASARATSTRCSTSSPRRRRCAAEDQYSPGGRTEHAAEPRDHRLREPLPPGLPRRARRPRRHRGVAPAHRPLRLLVRLGAALHPARRQGRPARLRHGRARRRGRSRDGSTRGEPVERSRDVRGTAHVVAQPRARGSARRGARAAT